MKNIVKRVFPFCTFICMLVTSMLVEAASSSSIRLKAGNFQLVLLENEEAPIRLAAQTLANDFAKVMRFRPQLVTKADNARGTDIVIINAANTSSKEFAEDMYPLDDFESHRIYCDVDKHRIYLLGKDMRGVIYAIYTFSEKFLEVPPLWFWCSWVPQHKDAILVPRTTDIFVKSPQVRYRAWLPNDTDLYSSWTLLSEQNNEIVYETMLRLKLNTFENAGLAYPGVSRGMLLCKKYGIIVTSHHMVMLNTTFSAWNKYWKDVRKVKNVPTLSLSNIDKLKELWEYGARTVVESGVENIWNIAFRGSGDQPFWVLFPDAPKSEKERAKVINEMLKFQVDIIKKYDKSEKPFIRTTFYDEMADLVTKGLVVPPTSENMIWTFCSGRRDHYPYNDIQSFNPSVPVKLGYYMNLQFTSTGSHLAPAEGPWKMEFNYRYLNNKSPLYLSVVNSGNFREYMYTMTANAKLLWNYTTYNTDKWNRDYAAQYFGEEYADKVASLYKDYFYAFWTQRKSDFPGGMERQFIFQDQRYARAIGYIGENFWNFNPKPLPDHYMYERVPGRVFRIVPEDNGAQTQIDAILVGMKTSVEKFADVTERAESLMPQLEKRYQRFFYDNLLAYSTFMEHLSKTLYHFTYAYKYQSDKVVVVRNLELALAEMNLAKDALYRSAHGPFEQWYKTDKKFDVAAVLDMIERRLDEAKDK